MREQRIDKLIDDTLNSLDAVKRAGPKPFLLTRVMAAVSNRTASQSNWSRAATFISRPGVAIAGILLIIFINISIFFVNNNDTDITGVVQTNTVSKDEFAINAIYDIENPEQ